MAADGSKDRKKGGMEGGFKESWKEMKICLLEKRMEGDI